MKVLFIGSASIHLSNYLDLVRPSLSDCRFVSNATVPHVGFPTITAPFTYRSVLSMIKTVRIIQNEISQYNPDLIHVHQANVYAFLTVLANHRFKKPVVLTAWGSDVLVLPFRSVIHRRILSWVLSRVNYITCGSAHMASVITSIRPDAAPNVVVANFGLRVRPDERPKEKMIYSNRLHEPIYRIDRIIHEFDSFRKTEEGKEWRLVIAGKGSETESLRRLVSELGLKDLVTFTGWLNAQENSEYYNRSMVYCSLPDSDSAAISVIEAMACGCIPLVTDLPAMRELVTDGENGLLVGKLESGIFFRLNSLSCIEAASYNRLTGLKWGDRTTNATRFMDLYKKAMVKS
jgi:glycosyltransferase involved in cell wall biosynthesis